MKINWDYCQLNSEEILAEGLYHLCTSENKAPCHKPGNYLILHLDKPYYIGEAEDIFKRLKTQFAEKRSTFYGNYIKHCLKINQKELVDINNFRVVFIETQIGRKEIEEFGIVNLPTILNRFQKGKRKKKESAKTYELWKEVQNDNADFFTEGENLFLNQIPIPWNKAIIPNSPGIYRVLNVDGKLIYIGESSNIKERYVKQHNKDTYSSALRRHIATEILGLQLIDGRRLLKENDDSVDEYLSKCSIAYMKVLFGRFELEKFLIENHSPLLNIKDNK